MNRSFPMGIQVPQLTVGGLVRVMPWSLSYLLISLVMKRNGLERLFGSTDLLDLVRVWAPDVLVAVSLVVVFGLLLSVRRPWVRWPSLGLLLLIQSVIIVADMASYRYFSVTGGVMSWDVIRFGFTNMAISKKIAASENSLSHVVVIVCWVVGNIVIHVAFSFRRLQERLAWNRPLPTRWLAGMVGATLVLVGLGVALGKADGAAMSLSRHVPWSVIKGLVRDELLSEKHEEVLPEERMSPEVRVAPGRGFKPYNVVIIAFESLSKKRAMTVVNGHPVTPHLEEFARESMLVERMYTVMPHTSKALVAILCGMEPYLGRNWIESTPFGLPNVCLPSLLGQLGYRSAFLQPAINFEGRDNLVHNMGFDLFLGKDDLNASAFEETNYFGVEDEVVVEPLLQWIDSAPEKPFLAAFLTLGTHHHYSVPSHWEAIPYDKEDPELDSYLNAARYTDEIVGMVLDGLKDRGLLDSTLVIIVGDHGEAFGEHGRWQHDLIMWEEGLNPFALLRLPGGPQPGTIQGTRSELDILATVLDVVGADVVEGRLQGSSLLEPVKDDRRLRHSCWWDRYCLAEHEGTLKVIHHFEERPTEVFLLENDPEETRNLAGQDPYDRSFLRSRKDELVRWRRVVNQQYEERMASLEAQRFQSAESDSGSPVLGTFGDLAEVVGFRGPGTVSAGGALEFEVTLRVLSDIPSGLRLELALWHHNGSARAGLYRGDTQVDMADWKAGSAVSQRVRIHVPGKWATGEGRLTISMAGGKAGEEVPLFIDGRQQPLEKLTLGTVTVQGLGFSDEHVKERREERIARSVTHKDVLSDNREGLAAGKWLRVSGMNWEQSEARPKGVARLDLDFLVLSAPPEGSSVELVLKSDEGGSENVFPHRPVGGLYLLRDWAAGDRIHEHIDLPLQRYCPPSGGYQLYLRVRDGNGAGVVDTPLGPVTVLPET